MLLGSTACEVGMVLQWADGTIAACNAAAEKILGMTIEQLQNSSLVHRPWQTIDADGEPFPLSQYPSFVALKTGQPCTGIEIGFYRPDGQLVWLQTDAQPLFSPGKPAPYAVTVMLTPIPPPTASPSTVGQSPAAQQGIRAVAAAIDITSPIQSQLRESDARYRALAESIPQLVWITTADGQNEYVNRQFCQFVGLSEAQLLNLDWLEIIHPDDRARTRDRWLTSVQNGEFYEIEYRFRRFDGTYRWFLGQGVPFKNDHGQVLKWFGTCTDIETQKQTELSRSRVIAQERAAREAAEQANQVKDEFLAVVSHELRTPLNPILGWSKLLLSGRLTPERTTEAIQTIERNAAQQAQLIDDLLDVSRILRNKLTLTVIPVDLTIIVTNAIETVRLSAEAKSIQLRSSLTSIGTVMGDPGRLQQVVWNLLSNAVKFTPQGGQIQVQLTRAGLQACLQVTDTGKGIAPEFLPHLFEAFRQEDNSTTRQFGGLGLGLSIVRQLVELHGGSVAADSPGLGQGATFTVCLPIGHDSPQSPVEVSMPASALTGMHVLLIDDVPDSRELARFVLEQAGAIVVAVASAQMALDQLCPTAPDVIISDVGMPDMNGLDLIRRIRQNFAEFRNTPAIALTAYATHEQQQQALEAGYDRHLAKPIDPTTLVETVAQFIDRNN